MLSEVLKTRLLFVIGVIFIVGAGVVYRNIELYLIFFLPGLGLLLMWAHRAGYFSDKIDWHNSKVRKG